MVVEVPDEGRLTATTPPVAGRTAVIVLVVAVVVVLVVAVVVLAGILMVGSGAQLAKS